MNLKNFLSELKRRNVWKAAMAYIIASWILLQVLAVLLPAFEATVYIKWVFYFLLAAFPFWLIFSWIYEITPNGLKRTNDIAPAESLTPVTGSRLNKIILAALGVAIVLLFINIFRNTPAAALEPEGSELGVLPADSLSDDRSIAVLAFADMSPQKDQEYFSDGISEEILNLLARIPELKVISRTSSFSFKDKDVTTGEIGEALKVNHILEGSVRKSGNTLRITAQLINARDGAHLWSQTYDRDMTDVFEIQEEIATEVTRQLKATLIPEPIRSREVDTEAYNLYLQARQLDNQFTAEATSSATELVKRSIAIDPDYAPAWALLSRLYSRIAYNFFITIEEDPVAEGIRAAEKAIELDPDFALGYANLSIFQVSNFDFTNAAINIKKARELEPNNPRVLTNSTIFNMVPPREKVKAMEKAIALSPLEYRHYFNLALFYNYDGDIETALEKLEIYALHFPNAAVLHYAKGMLLIQSGHAEAGYREILREEDDYFRLHGTISALYKIGKQKEGDSLLAEFVEEYPDEAMNIAQTYAFKGDKELAFRWLEKALAIKDPTLIEGLYYTEFRSLYSDPRWKNFINRIGLPDGHGVPLE